MLSTQPLSQDKSILRTYRHDQTKTQGETLQESRPYHLYREEEIVHRLLGVIWGADYTLKSDANFIGALGGTFTDGKALRCLMMEEVLLVRKNFPLCVGRIDCLHGGGHCGLIWKPNLHHDIKIR